MRCVMSCASSGAAAGATAYLSPPLRSWFWEDSVRSIPPRRGSQSAVSPPLGYHPSLTALTVSAGPQLHRCSGVGSPTADSTLTLHVRPSTDLTDFARGAALQMHCGSVRFVGACVKMRQNRLFDATLENTWICPKKIITYSIFISCSNDSCQYRSLFIYFSFVYSVSALLCFLHFLFLLRC